MAGESSQRKDTDSVTWKLQAQIQVLLADNPTLFSEDTQLSWSHNRHVLETQVHLHLQRAGHGRTLETRAWDDKGTLSTTGTALPHFVPISQAAMLLTVMSDSFSMQVTAAQWYQLLLTPHRGCV